MARKRGGGPTSRVNRGHAAKTVGDLAAVMEDIAPTWAAADWDNVGLLTGDGNWPLRRTLLTIDLTPGVLDEAVRSRADAIICYHPPIFRAVKHAEITRETTEGLAMAALANRIAIYSPHTALDCAIGGVNDVLAAYCGLIEVRPFEGAAAGTASYKLVVFIPTKNVETVAEALFAAGAGRIGDYEKCSYRLNGVGTFFGTESTNPRVGRRGQLERVDETRLEVVVPKRCLGQVIAALRQAHPYEEPAFDVYPIECLPHANIGQGRIGRLPRPIKLGALAAELVRRTKTRNPCLIGRPSSLVRRAFVCAGAAGSLPFEAPATPCGPGDVIVTGEIRHHDALRYARCGASAIALGHWASERPVLMPLSGELRRRLPGVTFEISRRDVDPFQTIQRSPNPCAAEVE